MKPFRGGTQPPRPTKGQLTAAAKAQTSKGEPPTTVKPEDVASMETVLGAALVGDQQAAAEAIVEQVKAPAQEESTVSTAATPQAEATPAPVAAKAPKTEGLYELGKRYAPKTERNSETWGKITKALADGPKSLKDLAEAIKGHNDFLGYMTRGGHIVPHVPKVDEAAVS